MELPDPIERGEARAEAWYDEHVTDGKFTCGCGRVIPLEDGVTASADPYSALICDACAGFDEFLKKEAL